MRVSSGAPALSLLVIAGSLLRHYTASYGLADAVGDATNRFLVQIADAEEQHRKERAAKDQAEADTATKGGKAQ